MEKKTIFVARYVVAFQDGMGLSQCEYVGETKEDLIARLKGDGDELEDIDVGPNEYGWQIEEHSL